MGTWGIRTKQQWRAACGFQGRIFIWVNPGEAKRTHSLIMWALLNNYQDSLGTWKASTLGFFHTIPSLLDASGRKDDVYASVPGQTSVSISMRVNPSTIGDWFFSQDMGTEDETKLQLRGLGSKLFQIIKDYQTTELCEKRCKKVSGWDMRKRETD